MIQDLYIFNNYSRVLVGFELLDSGQGAEHRIGYIISIYSMNEWNNCF